MATGMHMDERSVDCLVLGHHDQDRKVSAKSVTMRAMTLCKNLSGYRELLLYFINIVCQQTVLMKYPALFVILKKRQNLKLSSAANYRWRRCGHS